MSRTYRLIPITDLDEPVQLKVLAVRNEAFIRWWMLTDAVISDSEHLAWIGRLGQDGSQVCFVIVDDDVCPVGAVNLKRIDMKHKTAEMGFYRTAGISEKGLMAGSLSALIDYSFDVLGLDRIYTEVLEGNVKSLAIHAKLLFTEEGFLRSHIVKDGMRIGVHLFGLHKDEWRGGRDGIGVRNDIVLVRRGDSV
ncbi:MAG: UDP-4-amino-4,6-dideoxy-N-acetyl-beta-L-altrosamine N-acetyltransferase [Polyangiaceae bacterium]|nr:UDP-4-amino-4,6-dideoxy-N-acetyl-beta-L-altrosamine N-acetyltransferase [Polyangiaceae bacterium]